jgi:hypothetical protein
MANPQVTSAFTELAGAIVRTLITYRLLPSLSNRTLPATNPDPPGVTGGESPPTSDEGCPYCAAARTLAAGHLYLTRATEQPQMAHVYQRLAQLELVDAAKILLQVDASSTAQSLREQIDQIETTLRLPADTDRLSQAADELWGCSSQALALAEGHQENIESSECLTSEIENGIEEMESKMAALEGSYP